MTEGHIRKVILDKGFGFISVPNAKDVFFHKSQIDGSLEWDESLTERRVRFDSIETERGPKAVSVRAIN